MTDLGHTQSTTGRPVSEQVRILLAESDFDSIGHIYNDDVRAIIAELDAAVGEVRALRAENARLLREWDAQISGDLKARQTLCAQSDRYLAERDEARAALAAALSGSRSGEPEDTK